MVRMKYVSMNEIWKMKLWMKVFKQHKTQWKGQQKEMKKKQLKQTFKNCIFKEKCGEGITKM